MTMPSRWARSTWTERLQSEPGRWRAGIAFRAPTAVTRAGCRRLLGGMQGDRTGRDHAAQGDVDILNFALTLKYLGATFYAQAVGGEALASKDPRRLPSRARSAPRPSSSRCSIQGHHGQAKTSRRPWRSRTHRAAYAGAAPMIAEQGENPRPAALSGLRSRLVTQPGCATSSTRRHAAARTVGSTQHLEEQSARSSRAPASITG